MGSSDRNVYVDNDQSTAENLSDVLGELKIDESGIGMAHCFFYGFSRD
jgi:hypothetical protein